MRKRGVAEAVLECLLALKHGLPRGSFADELFGKESEAEHPSRIGRTTPMAHEPGPWVVSEYLDRDGEIGIVSAANRIVVKIGGDLHPDDARLIAAAPDLLEACKWLLSLHDDPCPYDAATTRAMARAVVAKAEGK